MNSSRRGLAMVAVLWGITITALLVSALLVGTTRMSMLGRDTMERVRARWAARAGAEATIATLAYHTQYPMADDAYALVRDLEAVHAGEVSGGTWLIQHVSGDTSRPFAGPQDEHSKLNVNGPYRGYIDVMFGPLAWGVFAAIEDWIDEDDEPSEFGVERDYYLSLDSRYEPRNAPLQSIAELELIAGIEPNDIRGEDWNLNSLLDPSEDDGDETLPWDNESGILDGGWARMLTVRSAADGATQSGAPRIWLMATDAAELIERFDVLGVELTEEKAESLINDAVGGTLDPTVLVTSLGVEPTPADPNQEEEEGQEIIWTPDEVAVILSETSVSPPHRRDWGGINVNTVSSETLYAMYDGDERLVEALLSLRTRRANGLTSLVDFWDLPGATQESLAQLLPLFCTDSSVFSITSRGRSDVTDEVSEINLVVDRSTLPVRILEYREN
ncbi:MAG: general secretion pathway protein GspK [Planctomycetes bacterium]|nr:general secretion pathway protein GspK [Planctomycetota bacterium]